MALDEAIEQAGPCSLAGVVAAPELVDQVDADRRAIRRHTVIREMRGRPVALELERHEPRPVGSHEDALAGDPHLFERLPVLVRAHGPGRDRKVLLAKDPESLRVLEQVDADAGGVYRLAESPAQLELAGVRPERPLQTPRVHYGRIPHQEHEVCAPETLLHGPFVGERDVVHAARKGRDALERVNSRRQRELRGEMRHGGEEHRLVARISRTDAGVELVDPNGPSLPAADALAQERAADDVVVVRRRRPVPAQERLDVVEVPVGAGLEGFQVRALPDQPLEGLEIERGPVPFGKAHPA